MVFDFLKPSVSLTLNSSLYKGGFKQHQFKLVSPRRGGVSPPDKVLSIYIDFRCRVRFDEPVSLCHFVTSPSHCEGVFPRRTVSKANCRSSVTGGHRDPPLQNKQFSIIKKL